MTDQELFDRVAEHLLTQGKQAKQGTTCVYRAPDGSKCAIGCLIPDEKYIPEFEDVNFSDNSDPTDWEEYKALLDLAKATGTTERQFSLARELQQCHDQSKPDEWRERLTRIAVNSGLSVGCLLGRAGK